MNLTGFSRGTNRADIVSKAKALASTYFDTECVKVELENEECQTEEITSTGANFETSAITYTADWSAQEHHRWQTPVYGPTRCITCKREDWDR